MYLAFIFGCNKTEVRFIGAGSFSFLSRLCGKKLGSPLEGIKHAILQDVEDTNPKKYHQFKSDGFSLVPVQVTGEETRQYILTAEQAKKIAPSIVTCGPHHPLYLNFVNMGSGEIDLEALNQNIVSAL